MAPRVLSANDGVAFDQAGGRRQRPRPYEKGPGGAAQAAPAESAVSALGLYPKHAATGGRAADRRIALLGGARRHPLPPGAGWLRGGFRQGQRQEILSNQGQAYPHPDRAADLQGLPGLALLRLRTRPARPVERRHRRYAGGNGSGTETTRALVAVIGPRASRPARAWDALT